MKQEERKTWSRRILDAQKSIDVYSYPYQICSQITKWFSEVMLHNERFVFDIPCNGYGTYTIYAIVNYDGAIMAEYIPNSYKRKGNYKRVIGTKGLESACAMVTAMRKYYLGEGTSEIHPEYNKNNITTTI